MRNRPEIRVRPRLFPLARRARLRALLRDRVDVEVLPVRREVVRMEAGYPPLIELVVYHLDVRVERHACRRDYEIRRARRSSTCTPGSRSTCS
jgi:hypothetical protein